MDSFKFLHAADLHLDSPLIGLTARSADFASLVDQASRRAFDNLVALAIEEQCRFVVLAGDCFDGDLRDFGTGLFFLSGLGKLRESGIRVFLIAGNHDAENRFADKIPFSDNVHRFGHKRPETVVLDDIPVVVHGRSFGRREVTENLAMDYPAPHSNLFNIGVLHTACEGREGHHAAYAPCSLEQLVNHGYDYWALGHVHARAVLNEHPHVVYPGIIQGRNPRETGPKGATLVEVAQGTVVACLHRDLDEVRWASEMVDVSGAVERGEVLSRVGTVLSTVASAAGGRPVALRLGISGKTTLHGDLVLDKAGLREDVEAMLATLPDDIWLEKLDLRTAAPTAPDEVDSTVGGRLAIEIHRLGTAAATELIESCLADIKVKMPAGARFEELVERLRAEAPARAVDIALSLVAQTEGRGADR